MTSLQNPSSSISPEKAGFLPMFSPLYQQIKALILRALDAGEWAPGTMIPSEMELASRFGVSQGTVRKAVDEMAAENLLVRRQGKGTFVATHRDPHVFYRFLRLIPDNGPVCPSRSKPVSCQELVASERVARALQLQQNDKVIAMERLLYFGDDNVVLDEIFLPQDLFAGLSLNRLQKEERSLYNVFESDFGIRMIRAEERLRAVLSDNRTASLLGVPEGSPLLLVERVAYTYGDRPVEWRRGFYNTERYHYFNELN